MGDAQHAQGFRILAINPGSTSTKVAVFDDEKQVVERNLAHSVEELSEYQTITDQYPLRKRVILEFLEEHRIGLQSINAVVGRGGLLHPIAGGTYEVNEQMVNDLHVGILGEHASNLGGIIASEIAGEIGVPAYIVDPVVVDELDDVARVAGIPEISRSSIFHALNQKAMARRAAAARGGNYDELNFIVVHLGGGTTVGAHRRGRVVDVNDGLNGEGPFTPERSGGLPALKVLKLAFSGEHDHNWLKKRIKGNGGLVAHLGTNDAREVQRRIDAGDRDAALVFEAMAYQVAKQIGAMAAVLEGRVDAIILTGGVAHNEQFCRWIEQRVGFIAPVEVYPGEDEMRALTEGALRVLRGEESAKQYRGGQ